MGAEAGRTAWRVLVAALVFAGACGGSGGPGGSDGPVGLDGLPGGRMVEAFSAGDDDGWVVGRAGDGTRLFAVRDGGVVRTTWSGDPHALGMEAFAQGVAVTNLRCTDGTTASSEDCDAAEGVVTFVGDGGTIEDEVVVWSAEGPASDSDGIALLGVSSTAAWVASDGDYLEVAPSEGIVGRVPRVDAALACVVNDDLYALSAYDARRYAGGAPAAWRRAGDTWAPVEGSTTQPPGGTAPLAPDPEGSMACQRDAIEVDELGDPARLLGRWTPADGWAPADPAAGPPHWRPTRAFERQGAFAVDAAGELVERGPDGHYAPTGITLTGFTGPGPMPPFHTDRSDDLLVACVGNTDGERLACHFRPNA